MDRSAMVIFDNYAAVVKRLGSDGLLLGSWDPQVVHCDPAISELL